MKFKILKGTETFNKLTVVFDLIDLANKEARELAASLGATEWCHSFGFYSIGGGLTGMRFLTKPPGWKLAFPKQYKDVYFPMNIASTIEVRELIKKLPIVEAQHLNDAVGYEEQEIATGGRTILSTHPAISKRLDMFLMAINEDAFYHKKPADIIEITSSEYKLLLNEAPNKELINL